MIRKGDGIITTKRALALGGGIDQLKLIDEFKRRGYYVIAVDKNEGAPGREKSDEFYPVSTTDEKKILELAVEKRVSVIGVVSAERPLLTATSVCEKLNLYYPISHSQALQVTNKETMKKIFVESGIPTSKHATVKTIDEFRLKSSYLQYPIVIKPVDSSAARGIHKISNEFESVDKVKDALQSSWSETCIIEECYKGQEISVDAVAINGETYVLMISDNYTMEAGDKFGLIRKSAYPSSISAQVKLRVLQIASEITQAFGITNSLLFFQMMVDNSDVYVIEFSARNAGGSKHFFIPLVTGLNIIDLYVRILLKEKIPNLLVNEISQHVSVNYIYCYEGCVNSIKGLDELYRDDLIIYYQLYKPPGHFSKGMNSGADRVGVFFTKSDTAESLALKNRFIDQSIKFLNDKGEDIMVHGIY